MELLRRWFYLGVTQADAEVNLRAVFDATPQQQRTRKWTSGWAHIPRWVQTAAAWVAKRRGTLFRSLVTFLSDEPHWRGAIKLNLFTQQIEVCQPFPPQPGQNLAVFRALLDPEDVLESMMCVQERGFPTVGKSTVRDALILVAKARAYHPVRDYLDGLTWDGTERLKNLFITYIPAELPDPSATERYKDIISYLEATARCSLCSAIKRVFNPGCKVDTLPVLVGAQAYLKSQAVAALSPDPVWFSDDVSTALIDRDTKEALSGKWLLELAEFPHIRREVEKVKAFFSRQTDRYRRAYDRANRDWPRQCVFFATTNELEFIDTTGNRRFWPILMHAPADVEMIMRDCDQLWAEAKHLIDSGFKWWLPPSLEAIAAAIQEDFLEEDTWVGHISDWLDGHGPGDPGLLEPSKATTFANRRAKRQLGFTIHEVLLGLGFSDLPGAVNAAKKADEGRTARVLRLLGYRPDQHQTRRNGERLRLWRLPEKKSKEAAE
jgi:predicted P-loop ATPase